MSTCVAVESFAGLALREPILIPQKFRRALRPTVRLCLLTKKRWGRGIVLETTPTLRRVFFQKEDSGLYYDFWFPRNAGFAKELRRARRRLACLGSGKDSQLLCQEVNPRRDESLEVVPLREVRVPDDALEGVLNFCRTHYFPQAGYGRSLPQSSFTYWDINTDTFVTVDSYVKPKRGAAHATISGSDFDLVVSKSTLPPEYKASLRLALVSGWTYKDAVVQSGVPFETFRRQAKRLLRKSPTKETFIPKERRFQAEQFAKGFGEVGVKAFSDKRIPTASGNREVPYHDGQALKYDEFEHNQIIFEGD